MSRKHHYVPKFYLKHFASESDRINIFNVDSSFAYRDGSLKNQCYRNHFHGPDDTLEAALSTIEGEVAPVIRKIVAHQCLPRLGTDAYNLLLLFLALQKSRTATTTDRLVDTSRKAAELVRGSYENVTEDQLAKEVEMTGLEATGISLKSSEAAYQCFLSMGMHLLVNRAKHRFITSNNPAFKYNLYCEGVKGTGIVGMARSGFMLFTPLSPSLVVLLYDQEVYKVGSRGASLTNVQDADEIAQLNAMQAVGCDSVILFSEWRDLEHIRKVSAKVRSHRSKPRNSVTEWEQVPSKRHESIIWMHETVPNLRLRLSFLSITRRARGLTMEERLIRYRKGTGLIHRPGLPCQPFDPNWRRKN